MEVVFDFRGEPVGGSIINYMLEKSRVVYQSPGERNFHIFYMLLRCGRKKLLKSLHLGKNPDQYRYLSKGNASTVDTMSVST